MSACNGTSVAPNSAYAEAAEQHLAVVDGDLLGCAGLRGTCRVRAARRARPRRGRPGVWPAHSPIGDAAGAGCGRTWSSRGPARRRTASSCWRSRGRRPRSPSTPDARRRGASTAAGERSRWLAAAAIARTGAVRRHCVDSARTSRPRRSSRTRQTPVGTADSTSGPCPAGRTTVSADTGKPAPRQRPHRPVERHLQRGRADHPHHQRADEPADRQPEQRPRRYHGTDHQVNRDERQQQRPPPPPPARRQPRARHGEYRGEHRDPAGIVEELRQHGVETLAQIEMPARRGDPVAR